MDIGSIFGSFTARDKGQFAYTSGVGVSQCPHAPGTRARVEWIAGWCDGIIAHINTIGR